MSLVLVLMMGDNAENKRTRYKGPSAQKEKECKNVNEAVAGSDAKKGESSGPRELSARTINVKRRYIINSGKPKCVRSQSSVRYGRRKLSDQQMFRVWFPRSVVPVGISSISNFTS
jgi:hypothetical protein